jgi:glycosyltransferase involved in cell wall biosynthesis
LRQRSSDREGDLLTAEPAGGSPASNLSVILPAYNEEENVEEAVTKALEVLPKLAVDFEVIVVNDGSVDRTAEIVQTLVSEHHPRVRLLCHLSNRGYGAALRTGFGYARHDLVFYTDADNQFDVSELQYFISLIDSCDAVVGFRVYRYDSVLRSMMSWVYNRIVRVLFRVRVRDVDCSFKLFRREVLEKITPIQCEDFFVDTELVAKVRKWNFRVVEKGVRHYPRVGGETTVRSSDVPRTLRTVLSMWQRIYLPTRRQLEEAARTSVEGADSAVEAVPTPK